MDRGELRASHESWGVHRKGSCYMQGESRITSHLHDFATNDIAVSTDVVPGLV